MRLLQTLLQLQKVIRANRRLSSKQNEALHYGYGDPCAFRMACVPHHPELNAFSNESEHLWQTLLGFKGDPHLNPIHPLSNVLIAVGFIFLACPGRCVSCGFFPRLGGGGFPVWGCRQPFEKAKRRRNFCAGTCKICTSPKARPPIPDGGGCPGRFPASVRWNMGSNNVDWFIVGATRFPLLDVQLF